MCDVTLNGPRLADFLVPDLQHRDLAKGKGTRGFGSIELGAHRFPVDKLEWVAKVFKLQTCLRGWREGRERERERERLILGLD